MRRFLSPDFVRHMSAVAEPLDRETQIQRLQGIKAAFPDLTITADAFVAEADIVVTRATLRGTHEGDLLGIPGTGTEVEVTIVDMIRVADGVMVEQWGGPDMLDMVRQVGGIIKPPE